MKNNSPDSFKGQLLMAMPLLVDHNFYQTVTCICEYTSAGTVGIVINRVHPSLTVKDIFNELNMGFIPDIRRVMKLLPKKRQSLMLSATFPEKIRTLAKTIVNDPVEISVTPKNTTTTLVEQWLHPVDKKKKPAPMPKDEEYKTSFSAFVKAVDQAESKKKK